MKYFKYSILATSILFLFSCESTQFEESSISNPDLIHQSMDNLSDVIVYDIFSPPVASRIYAYASIASYEAMRPGYDASFASLAGQISGLFFAPYLGFSTIPGGFALGTIVRTGSLAGLRIRRLPAIK